MEFVIESSGVRGRTGQHGACCREWSGVRCRDLPESGGAVWNPLQRVEQGGGSHRGLSESLDPLVEARLGCLMEQRGSSHRHPGRGSDVPRSLTFQVGVTCRRSSDGDFLLAESGEV